MDRVVRLRHGHGVMEGFEHDLVDGRTELLRRHSDALKALIGRRLSAVWAVWDVGDDAWLADAPLVLDFQGTRLELACQGLASISVTWGTLDLSRQPKLYDGDGFVLEWTSNAPPELAAVAGQVLRDIGWLEYRFETTVVADRESASVGDEYAAWVLVGVEFTFEDGFISVHNGLDENAVAATPLEGPQFRRGRIARPC